MTAPLNKNWCVPRDCTSFPEMWGVTSAFHTSCSECPQLLGTTCDLVSRICTPLGVPNRKISVQKWNFKLKADIKKMSTTQQRGGFPHIWTYWKFPGVHTFLIPKLWNRRLQGWLYTKLEILYCLPSALKKHSFLKFSYLVFHLILHYTLTCFMIFVMEMRCLSDVNGRPR